MTATTLNLPPAPPGFRGLNPDRRVGIYFRRLPHWRQRDATYFVTFHLADALPQEKQRLLQRMRDEWERSHPRPRREEDWKAYARAITESAERWLDEGYGACHFRDRRWCEDLRERLHQFHGERYQLWCWAIMPNHCHAVIRPLMKHSLEDLLGAIEGVTARYINEALGTAGALWEQESYDQILRDEEHLWRVIQYIGRNPGAAGLEAEAAWRRWIHPQWEAKGWGFREAR